MLGALVVIALVAGVVLLGLVVLGFIVTKPSPPSPSPAELRVYNAVQLRRAERQLAALVRAGLEAQERAVPRVPGR